MLRREGKRWTQHMIEFLANKNLWMASISLLCPSPSLPPAPLFITTRPAVIYLSCLCWPDGDKKIRERCGEGLGHNHELWWRKKTPDSYQRLDLFIKVLRVLCPNLTDASFLSRPHALERSKKMAWKGKREKLGWEERRIQKVYLILLSFILTPMEAVDK